MSSVLYAWVEEDEDGGEGGGRSGQRSIFDVEYRRVIVGDGGLCLYTR